MPISPERLSGQRVVVTGASGFLGSHLCRELRDRAAEVHAVSRTVPSGDTIGVHWRAGDLADMATVRSVLKATRPDVVYHLTSHGRGAPDRELVLPTFRCDLAATVNMLTGVTELGCRRLILLASLEEPRPEGTGVPVSPYAAAKWAGTGYARMFHQLYGTPVVITRVFMTYGPGQRPHKLIPYVILSLLRGEAPQVTSGQRSVDWIYVDDVIRGLLAAAVAAGVEGDPIELGTGTLVPIREVVELLVKLTHSSVEPAFGALPDRPMENVRRADRTAAFAKLGWQPEVPLEEGLERTVEWYRRHISERSAAGRTSPAGLLQDPGPAAVPGTITTGGRPRRRTITS